MSDDCSSTADIFFSEPSLHRRGRHHTVSLHVRRHYGRCSGQRILRWSAASTYWRTSKTYSRRLRHCHGNYHGLPIYLQRRSICHSGTNHHHAIELDLGHCPAAQAIGPSDCHHSSTSISQRDHHSQRYWSYGGTCSHQPCTSYYEQCRNFW